MLARISIDQALDAHKDPRTTGSVLERVDPSRVLVGLYYSHNGSVAQTLQLSTVVPVHQSNTVIVICK